MVIVKADFKQINNDPCLMMQINNLGTVIIIIYVYVVIPIGI